ncbi:DUF2637 domain-containing protein [Cryptosporangium phraense]|uniref:DUF2637 domain-containing protein n=2 Tax=Cryptosporangium phraense TaxID=2593070 RepID=A0A545AY03_9ACTN|nr:DUF2637 domain-containing protein [Cryptosporangium phraense]
MVVSAASAAVASFSGLRGLADASGWAPELAWLLPVTVDAYATTSARVWLAASTRSAEARRFARANALGAITVSIAGNAVYHAAETGLLEITWPVVVVVGAIPAAVLGLTSHLHALRSRPPSEPMSTGPVSNESASDELARIDGSNGADPSALPNPVEPGWPVRRTPERPRSNNDLLAAARLADRRYRVEHDGRPITRDALRAALHIGGRRATELRRQLAELPAGPTESDPVPAVHVPEREENDDA